MLRFQWRRVVALFLVAFTFACADRNDADESVVTDSAAAGSAAPAPLLSDAEIAHIAVTANTIDAETGEFAKCKAQNAEVRTFA